MTKKLTVGGVVVGGGAPVTIQSMCNTKTHDVDATVAQIHALEDAGCEIVRVAVPDMAAATAVDAIKARISIPLIADIHLTTSWPLHVRSGELMLCALIQATSGAGRMCGQWRRPVGNGASPSGSALTAALWKRSCGRNTAASPQRLW